MGKERSNVNPIPFTVAFESDPSVKNHDVIRELELSMRPYVLRPKVYLVNAAKFNAVGGASKYQLMLNIRFSKLVHTILKKDYNLQDI